MIEEKDDDYKLPTPQRQDHGKMARAQTVLLDEHLRAHTAHTRCEKTSERNTEAQ